MAQKKYIIFQKMNTNTNTNTNTNANTVVLHFDAGIWILGSLWNKYHNDVNYDAGECGTTFIRISIWKFRFFS